jgi:hypothetical protein
MKKAAKGQSKAANKESPGGQHHQGFLIER